MLYRLFSKNIPLILYVPAAHNYKLRRVPTLRGCGTFTKVCTYGVSQCRTGYLSVRIDDHTKYCRFGKSHEFLCFILALTTPSCFVLDFATHFAHSFSPSKQCRAAQQRITMGFSLLDRKVSAITFLQELRSYGGMYKYTVQVCISLLQNIILAACSKL